MFKTTVNYKDYNGGDCTEDLYFNMTEPEALRFVYGMEGNTRAMLEAVNASSNKEDPVEIINRMSSEMEMFELIERLISLSYGKKSEDGKRFEKNKENTEAFLQSAAYSKFFMDTVMDEEKSMAFVNAILPASLNIEVATKE